MRRTGVRDVLATAALALLCASAAGCSASESGNASRHVGTYDSYGEGGDAALLEGTVRLVDGCLFVEQRDVGERYLVYFPDREVEWSDDGLRYAGSTYGAGDAIALGGGASGVPQPVPSDCRQRFETLPQWTVARSG